MKKFGKDVKIGEAETKEEAFTTLKKKLKTTLRASGYVLKEKKKVSPGFLFDGEFRRGKRDPLRVVQKKGRRFGALGETKEAQYFRKVKKGKKRNLLGL